MEKYIFEDVELSSFPLIFGEKARRKARLTDQWRLK
jgi:hypothetical protein